MSERKVLNKYYPIDFEFYKLPKLEKGRPKQYVVRLMAPFTMRCNTCGEYIYHGRKFNARKETVEGERYLGIPIFRFYIRCTRCLSEITFKTDPKTTDYVPEHGAVRTFQAERVAEKMAENERKEKEEEEANDPMLALENRTRDSKYEMDVLDALEEIKDQNARFEQVDLNQLLMRYKDEEQKQLAKQEEEDEALVQSVFNTDQVVHRLNDDDEDEEEEESSRTAAAATSTAGNKRPPTDILVAEGSGVEPEAHQPKKKKEGGGGEEKEEGSGRSSKVALSALVKRPVKGKAVSKMKDLPPEAASSNVVEEGTHCQLGPSGTGSSDPGVMDDMSHSKVTASLDCQVSAKPSGLGLLGSYSSDSDNDSTHS